MRNKPQKRSAKIEYRWKSFGAGRHKVAAATFGSVIEEIKKKHGGELTDARIVNAARSNGSPIHGMFEWDNSVAGEKYRIEQAAFYRRHVVIIVAGGEGKEKTGRYRVAHIAVRNEQDEIVHRDAVEVMSREDLRIQAIADAISALLEARKRFAHITELSDVFRMIDAAAQSFTKKEMRRKIG